MSSVSPPSKPLDAELLDRYLAGTCTPVERAQVETWLAEAPEARAVVDALQTMPLLRPSECPAGDMAADWKRIAEQTLAFPSSGDDQTRTKSLNDNAARGIRSGGIGGVFGKKRPFSGGRRPEFERNSIKRASGRRLEYWGRYTLRGGIFGALLAGVIVGQRFWIAKLGKARYAGSYLAYVTESQQVAHLTLPDGTRVTLAPNSVLRVGKNFQAQRNVALIGEAYFDVVRSSGTPFFVHTGHIISRVLGTAFDVRYYATDAPTRVAVLSGKVAVQHASTHQPSVTLTAGTIAVITDSTAVTSVGAVGRIVAWTSGALSFDGTPAREVLTTVGHWYGYEFRVTDSTLARQPLTVRFDGDPVDVVLRSLETVLNATMTYHGHIITFSPRHATESASPLRTPDTPFHPLMEVGR